MQDYINRLKNKLFIFSFGLGLASTVGIVNPDVNIKQLGAFGLGGAIFSVGLAEILTSATFTQLNKFNGDTSQELTDKWQQIFDLQKTVDKLLSDLEHSQTLRKTLQKELENSGNIILQRGEELNVANKAISTLELRLQGVGEFSANEAYSIVRRTYKKSVKKLEGLLDALVRNYPQVAEELNLIYIEVDSMRSRFIEKLDEYDRLTTFDELLDVGMTLQEHVIDRCTECKVKAQTIVIRHLSSIVGDSVPFTDYETHIQNLTSKAILQIELLKEEHHLNQKAIAQEWVSSNNDMVNKYDTEFVEVVNTGKYAVSKIQAMEQIIQNLTDRINELEKPIEWRSGIFDSQDVGNLIIRFLWRQGIRLDRAFIHSDPYEPILYFNTNRLDDIVKVDEINKFSEALQQHVDLLLEPPHFTYNGQYGLLQTKIKFGEKPKQTRDELAARIPDCKSLVSKSKRGFLITGHPGAGKTSAMKAIAQWLGDESSMRLALNPHSDEMSNFEDSGFVEINNIAEIYDAVSQLDAELKLRAEDKTRRQLLIVAVDELGRIIKDEPKDLDVMEILKQAAVEGRKFNVIVLIGNHSQTTKAIDMDSQFRDAFYQMFLVGAAVSRINMPNAPALKRYEEDWIRTAAYPVLTGINGRFQSCQHPTHWTYKEYQDFGNPPVGLIEMKPNTVIVGNKRYYPMFETAALSELEKQLIASKKDQVSLDSGAGLSRLIEEVKGIKASKSDEYKRIKNEVWQYLKTLC